MRAESTDRSAKAVYSICPVQTFLTVKYYPRMAKRVDACKDFAF